MRRLVQTVFLSVPKLLPALGLMMFFELMMSIVGTSLFGSKVRRRCRLSQAPMQLIVPPSPNEALRGVWMSNEGKRRFTPPASWAAAAAVSDEPGTETTGTGGVSAAVPPGTTNATSNGTSWIQILDEDESNATNESSSTETTNATTTNSSSSSARELFSGSSVLSEEERALQTSTRLPYNPTPASRNLPSDRFGRAGHKPSSRRLSTTSGGGRRKLSSSDDGGKFRDARISDYMPLDSWAKFVSDGPDFIDPALHPLYGYVDPDTGSRLVWDTLEQFRAEVVCDTFCLNAQGFWAKDDLGYFDKFKYFIEHTGTGQKSIWFRIMRSMGDAEQQVINSTRPLTETQLEFGFRLLLKGIFDDYIRGTFFEGDEYYPHHVTKNVGRNGFAYIGIWPVDQSQSRNCGARYTCGDLDVENPPLRIVKKGGIEEDDEEFAFNQIANFW